MASASERFIDAQRTLFETSQTIGRRGWEGAGQLLELNVQTSGALLAASTNPVAGLVASTSICGPSGLRSAALPGETIRSYVPRAMEIMSGTNAEIGRLLLQQVSQVQALLSDVLTEQLRQAPDGVGRLFAMPGFQENALQGPIDQAQQPAAEAAAETAGSEALGAEASKRIGKPSLQAEE